MRFADESEGVFGSDKLFGVQWGEVKDKASSQVGRSSVVLNQDSLVAHREVHANRRVVLKIHVRSPRPPTYLHAKRFTYVSCDTLAWDEQV